MYMQVSSSINPIIMTDAAIKKTAELLAIDGDPNLKLRVYIVGGGCSGFEYVFAFDAKENDDDIVMQFTSIKLVVDSTSLNYLEGATIHYTSSLQSSRFEVTNPNAQTTCGCGSSFSV
jgi:iron-sulfur cluster insertion protein